MPLVFQKFLVDYARKYFTGLQFYTPSGWRQKLQSAFNTSIKKPDKDDDDDEEDEPPGNNVKQCLLVFFSYFDFSKSFKDFR